MGWHEERVSLPQNCSPQRTWFQGSPLEGGRQGGVDSSLSSHFSLPLFLTAAHGKYNIHVFPSLSSLSREGTDGRNLCSNPALAVLALGRGDAGAEIHPGSTNFTQHLGKRAAAGASKSREQRGTGRGEGGGEKKRGTATCM